MLNGACTPFVNPAGSSAAAPRLYAAHFRASDRAILPVRHWLPGDVPTQAVIVALHGFNDYSYFFEQAGRYLSQQGIACYAYDQRGFGNAPGFGSWAGSASYSRDLSEFTAEVRRLHAGLPVYILGESMGGAIAMAAFTGSHPPDADGVILVAPAVWGRETMPWYQRWLLAVTSRTVPWMRLTGSGLQITPSDNIEMLRALSRDPLVIKGTRIDAMHGLTDLMDLALANASQLRHPALLLYGERDEIIPKKPVAKMLEAMGNCPELRTAFYQQGFHMLLRDLQAKKPWDDIVAWISDKNRPLPSGADLRIPGEFAAVAKVRSPDGG